MLKVCDEILSAPGVINVETGVDEQSDSPATVRTGTPYQITLNRGGPPDENAAEPTGLVSGTDDDGAPI